MQATLQGDHTLPQSTRRMSDAGRPHCSDPSATASAHSALHDSLNALEWARLARVVADVSAGWMALEPCEVDAFSRDLLEHRLDPEGSEEQPDRIAWFSQPRECRRWLHGALDASSQPHWVR